MAWHFDAKGVVEKYGLAGIFLVSFLSATLLPGISEVGLAGLVAMGTFKRWPLLLSATAGNWLGGAITFAMFWYGVDGIDWLGLKQDEIDSVMSWAKEWGGWCGILVWVPVVGDPLAAALGIIKASPALTLITMFIGKAARYVIVLFVTSATVSAVRLRSGENNKLEEANNE